MPFVEWSCYFSVLLIKYAAIAEAWQVSLRPSWPSEYEASGSINCRLLILHH